MSALGLYDTIWAVICPIVGWPFGVFLLKQFAEGIPTEMVEACRIDGASEWRTFADVMFPMIKPGVGACAIFTFINSWNDYFMELIMLTGSKSSRSTSPRASPWVLLRAKCRSANSETVFCRGGALPLPPGKRRNIPPAPGGSLTRPYNFYIEVSL